LQPDSDLGTRLVTRDVGALTCGEIADALEAGVARARELLAAGLIDGAVLRLHGEIVGVGTRLIEVSGSRAPLRGPAMKDVMHA
jgi:hypothetical protein